MGARGQTLDVHQRSTLNGKRFNADRVLNRFWDYPRFARQLGSQFDLFHVIDHSYGQLIHELPPKRTIVTCHDLDTFQCLLNPAQEPRSFLFRKMMSRTLSGFRQAARVACVSNATRDELVAHGLIESSRAVVIANGVHPACSPNADPVADEVATEFLGPADGQTIDLLHVGSTIPRKRIDLLLRIFAAVHKELPEVRLVRVGGSFTPEQSILINELGIAGAIVVLPRLESDVLAAVYRRATILLLPSEREGFGLPVIEAMACGTPVIATDLPVLREVGGEAAVYCALDDVAAWKKAAVGLLTNEDHDDRRAGGLAQAAKYSWAEHARKTVDLYQDVLKQ